MKPMMGNEEESATPAPEIANAPSQEDAGAQAAAEQPGNEDEGMGGEQATPEEQDAYTRVVLAGSKVLFADETHAQVVEALKAGEPARALADLVATIMLEMDRQANNTIPESVIIPASGEILSQAAELAEKLGAQIDEQVFTAAAQMLVMRLAKEYGINPEDAKAAIAGMDPAQVQSLAQGQQQAAASWAGAPDGQQPQPQQPAPPMGAQ